MSLLSQHLLALIPQPIKHNPSLDVSKAGTAISPLLSVQARQSQITPVAPAAAASDANFPSNLMDQSGLPDRGQHDLQALLRVMQGIEAPEPKGELVDLLVPRPTPLDP
jgi:hypothetical protein